jgi:hypothetical protein
VQRSYPAHIPPLCPFTYHKLFLTPLSPLLQVVAGRLAYPDQAFSPLANQSKYGGQYQSGNHWQAGAGFPVQGQAEAQNPLQARFQAHARVQELFQVLLQANSKAKAMEQVYLENQCRSPILYQAWTWAKYQADTVLQLWNQAMEQSLFFHAQSLAQCETQVKPVVTMPAPPSMPPHAARISPDTVIVESVGAFEWLICVPPRQRCSWSAGC